MSKVPTPASPAAAANPDPAPDRSAKDRPTSPVSDFETCLAELETLVARMEQGELNLDDSLGAFERGISLFRRCQQALDQAELKVQQLLDPEDPDSALPLVADDEPR